ncbi:AbrB/MazE/SpoVT family DNA-binding domain-containing protein [Thermococcus sp. GR7]|uniref:AbrB/MazE/SpoVT family DNA-binding domain-containing protein n=1 Tax=unclassified Thermococcus TaxID=2627626 RepID=UPI001430B289|nr:MULTISPECIES: AbrB/MazE/SpoVT family DNA-binding domain-containing protein [unclassified Thermococcus]NJE46766.1 AbrB/MazE/SpoVT family DNA-binding domain-containing protein [Thermococcus sp. GR7]NJE77806.1 AbrB/MazE/SpoVT family DNA-binding domain-containing protein [Thermococcus sp. GR4]NJF22934.1 AbrB/MazE/SpoVT family DNA-binding domain-containing protein [Thermococcus sp. GR5]
MGLTKVTRNYQITIPSDVRKKLGIRVGDVLVVEVKDGKVVLKKSELELPLLPGGKGLKVEDIEEAIRRGQGEEE